MDLTPSEIVEVAREDRRGFENVLLDFVTRLREEGKASSYIENYLTCVRSWLQFNDINLVRKIKIGNTSRTPTIEDEMIPPKGVKTDTQLCPGARTVLYIIHGFQRVKTPGTGKQHRHRRVGNKGSA